MELEFPLVGGGGIDTDAQAFITAANITDTTQQNAINTLVTQLKTYGIWTKMKALYPFVGGTASSHKFNLKDPRDLDAAYRLVFAGGWTHSSTGALPNGTNAYADTKLNLNTTQPNSTSHLSYYSRTLQSASNVGEIGSINSIFQTANSLYLSDTGTLYGYNGFSKSVTVTGQSNQTAGYYILNAHNLNLKVFKNNTQLGTTTSLTSYSTNNDNVYIGAIKGNTSALYYSGKQSAFASIGDGLTDTEAANFYTAVQTFQTTLGRQVGVPIVADSDAQAFLNAAVITDSTQASAINTLVTDLKTANIWTKMKALYPFIGGTATSHKFNLKDPRDLDAAYRLVFNGGWTHSSTGALPNGTNGYADTKFKPNTLTAFSSHLSYYSRTQNASTTSHDIGCEDATVGNNFDLYQYYAGSVNQKGFLDGSYPTNAAQVNSTNTLGFQIGTRTSNILQKVFFNNSLIATNTNTKTLSYPAINVTIGATNQNGVINAYSNKQTAFASIGDGLTDAEATAFYTAVQAYQTTLGRQV